MSRKLIASGLALVAAASVVGGATYAKFSDKEVAAAQSIKAGTLNLTLDGSAESAPIALTNAKPGDRAFGKWDPSPAPNGTNLPSVPAGLADKIIHLKNDGTVNGVVKAYIVKDSDTENGCNAPEAAVDTTCDTPGAGTGELDSNIDLMLGGSTVSGFGSMAVGDKALVTSYALAAGAEAWHRVYFEIPESVGNVIQSDGTSFHYEFVLEQA